MARTDTLTNFLADIATAIKAKKNSTAEIPAANFDTEITALSGGDNSALVKLIDRSATSITVPDGTQMVGNYAFADCFQLSSLVLPNSIYKIGSRVITGCPKLKSLTIPEGVTAIEDYAFSDSSLTEISIHDTVGHIGKYAFENCSGLTSLTLPSAIGSGTAGVFSGCSSLKTLTIPSGILFIQPYFFANCSSLTSVTFLGNINSVECNTVFRGCSSLSQISFPSNSRIPVLKKSKTFSQCASDLQIKVPQALLEEWKAAENWSAYADKIVAI